MKTTEQPPGERSLDFGSRRITNEKRAPHFPGGEGRVRLNGGGRRGGRSKEKAGREGGGEPPAIIERSRPRNRP